MTTFILNTGNARERMVAVWRFACQYLELGKAVRVDIKECKSTRSLEQNARPTRWPTRSSTSPTRR